MKLTLAQGARGVLFCPNMSGDIEGVLKRAACTKFTGSSVKEPLVSMTLQVDGGQELV